MTPEQRAAAIAAIEAQEALLERKQRTKLSSFYPDQGPLRRDLYPKHMAFFAAGFTHRERCMMAGNRVGKCISGDTLIDCPRDEGMKVKDIRGQHMVWAWAGPKRGRVEAWADEPFKKPPEMVYRVWLQSGRFVDCAAEHRFLSLTGWLFLSSLFGYVPCLPLTTSEFGPISSLSDVMRYLETAPNSRVGYHHADHSCDVQPQLAQDTDRSWPPSLGDVQRRNAALWFGDGPGDTGIHNRPQLAARLSSRGASAHLADRCVALLNQIAGTDEQSYRHLLQGSRQLANVAVAGPQSTDRVQSRLSQSCAIVSPDLESDFIIGYQEVGIQDIWDFHVPEFHNYCTAGMVHHNTEGAGGYETVLHLTGLYPHWWIGRRFLHPVNALVAGDTGTTTRDILQNKICGPVEKPGTGLIPHANMGETSGRAGVAGAYDIVKVKHEPTGGWSTLQFRSYDQGRVAFQGTEREVVYLDEEPPKDVYDECLLRTMTTNGIVLCTFTPLLGLSDVALSFMPHLAPAI